MPPDVVQRQPRGQLQPFVERPRRPERPRPRQVRRLDDDGRVREPLLQLPQRPVAVRVRRRQRAHRPPRRDEPQRRLRIPARRLEDHAASVWVRHEVPVWSDGAQPRRVAERRHAVSVFRPRATVPRRDLRAGEEPQWSLLRRRVPEVLAHRATRRHDERALPEAAVRAGEGGERHRVNRKAESCFSFNSVILEPNLQKSALGAAGIATFDIYYFCFQNL